MAFLHATRPLLSNDFRLRTARRVACVSAAYRPVALKMPLISYVLSANALFSSTLNNVTRMPSAHLTRNKIKSSTWFLQHLLYFISARLHICIEIQ